MKKFNLIIALISGSMLFQNSAYSQDHFSCGLPDKLDALYEAYPDLERDQQELIENSRRYIASDTREDEEILVIPVVFHIIHENGVENISDAQVYDQMEILNRDFRKLNADTVDIMDEFKPISTDTKIEFRLANKDPYGNCTNGIEHIYSHETLNGDDYSKLNQWPRGRYLNVWIVKSMAGGVAGYAYYPSAVATGLRYADGIIIRHNYIGSIGTSSTYNSRALTHEIGHWLGLPHTWGNTNSPGVACGDDGIDDTPETAGYTSCILVGTENCNDTIAENVQNYMEYSYCSRMFTNDQSAVMNTSLANGISLRNNLHTETNREATGTAEDAVLCTPLPDFYTNYDIICAGNNIQFLPSVSRAEVDSYEWYFPGGTPEYSSEMAPIVTYNTPGVHDAQLTVTNAAGSETMLKTQYVYAMGDYWLHEGPYSENFESDGFDNNDWIVLNPENNEVKWEAIDHAGASGNNCIGLEYFKASPDPIIEPHYYQQMGGTRDILISPSFNLNNTSSTVLSFKYIYATTNAGVYSPNSLNLRISYWKDCSSSWVYLDNLAADDLICVGHKATAFYPNGADAWQNVSITLPPGTESSNVRFKFEFTAEDFSNNFLMDDINVSGVLTDGREDLGLQNVSLYPNPSTAGQVVNLNYYSTDNSPLNIQVYDLLGNLVYSTSFASTVGMNKQEINMSSETLSKGIYNVVISNETQTTTERLILN